MSDNEAKEKLVDLVVENVVLRSVGIFSVHILAELRES